MFKYLFVGFTVSLSVVLAQDQLIDQPQPFYGMDKSSEWSSFDDNSFYNAPLAPPPAPGFSLAGIVGTSVSVIFGLFLLTFTFAFLRNIINSKFVNDLLDNAVDKARSIDIEDVDYVASLIGEAYAKFQQ